MRAELRPKVDLVHLLCKYFPEAYLPLECESGTDLRAVLCQEWFYNFGRVCQTEFERFTEYVINSNE